MILIVSQIFARNQQNHSQADSKLVPTQLSYFFFLELNDPVANVKYSEMNAKIEYISEFYVNFVMRFNTVAVYLPAVFITIINYFVLDMDKDQSYFLPMSILYVSLTRCLSFHAENENFMGSELKMCFLVFHQK